MDLLVAIIIVCLGYIGGRWLNKRLSFRGKAIVCCIVFCLATWYLFVRGILTLLGV